MKQQNLLQGKPELNIKCLHTAGRVAASKMKSVRHADPVWWNWMHIQNSILGLHCEVVNMRNRPETSIWRQLTQILSDRVWFLCARWPCSEGSRIAESTEDKSFCHKEIQIVHATWTIPMFITTKSRLKCNVQCCDHVACTFPENNLAKYFLIKLKKQLFYYNYPTKTKALCQSKQGEWGPNRTPNVWICIKWFLSN